MDINKETNIKLAINHTDEAIRSLFAIHDQDTLPVMQDLSDCIWRLRDLLNMEG
jgi:hypothetical protein